MDFLKNLVPREYQEEIFKTCLEKNCLVVLPTGLGKTLIALMVSIERMKKYPGEKVLFLAPTKPLAEQHLAYFKKNLPELFGSIELFTGAISAPKRKKIWKEGDIIFSTPQCIANDLKKRLYNLSEVCLLVEDEAHRCVKNYDYNFVSKTFQRESTHPRIIGLTASPGSDSKKIKEICENLFIEEVELRTRDSIDVKKYLQTLEFEKREVELTKEFIEIRNILKNIFDEYTDELKMKKFLFGPVSKFSLIELQRKIGSQISRNFSHPSSYFAISLVSQAIKLSHAIDLLETQTLESFHKYLKKLFAESEARKSRGIVKLVSRSDFKLAHDKALFLLERGGEHPKVQEIIRVVRDEKNNSKNPKIIIFTQFRETANLISKNINKLSGIKSKVFVGQAKKESGGLNQKEQKEIIDAFSTGETNVLCATSLHPEEYLVLKNENKITIKTIGEFVNTFLKKGENSKKIKSWEALTTEGQKTFFKPITHVHKHESKNNLINVRLNSGFETRITKNHELFTFGKKKQFIKTHAEKNKFIALPLKCKNIQNETIIDLEKELIKTNLLNVKKHVTNLSQSKIRILKTNKEVLSKINEEELNLQILTKKTKKNYSTILNCTKRLLKEKFISQKRIKQNNRKISEITSLGKEYLIALEYLMKNIKYNKGKYLIKLSGKTPNNFDKFFDEKINICYGKLHFPRYIKPTKELAKFLGFYVSEGHTRKTKKTSGIFLAAMNTKIQKLMKDSIEKGLGTKAKVTKKGVAIYSQMAHYLIEHVFRAGVGAYHKEVPEFVFTSKNDIKWAFLEAYTLGDGHIHKRGVVLTTVSRKLVTGIIFLLRSLGIKKITLYKQKHIYKININESLPFAKIKEENSIRPKAYYSLIPTALRSKTEFDKNSNIYNPKERTRKKGEWKEEICYDYIKEIKKEKNTKFVYDITVKDTKNFIGGTGLMCLHNCIAEEGLDIPEVDLVILYEPVSSAIRSIQRRGRTARLSKGKLIMLITKGTRDEFAYYTSRAREKKMEKSIKEIKEEMNLKNSSEKKPKQESLF